MLICHFFADFNSSGNIVMFTDVSCSSGLLLLGSAFAFLGDEGLSLGDIGDCLDGLSLGDSCSVGEAVVGALGELIWVEANSTGGDDTCALVLFSKGLCFHLTESLLEA